MDTYSTMVISLKYTILFESGIHSISLYFSHSMWLRNIGHLQQSSINQRAKSPWGRMTHDPNTKDYRQRVFTKLVTIVKNIPILLHLGNHYYYCWSVIRSRQRTSKYSKYWNWPTASYFPLLCVLKEPVIINQPIKNLQSSRVCFGAGRSLATGVIT